MLKHKYRIEGQSDSGIPFVGKLNRVDTVGNTNGGIAICPWDVIATVSPSYEPRKIVTYPMTTPQLLLLNPSVMRTERITREEPSQTRGHSRPIPTPTLALATLWVMAAVKGKSPKTRYRMG